MSFKIKSHFFPFVFLLVMALGMNLYFFMAKALPTPIGGDPVSQYLIFHYFLHDLFSNGEYFWSWKYGLGGDIFGQFIYYYTTSLFFWLSLLFDVDSLKDIIYIKFFFSLLKSYLGMLFMYMLLRYHQKSILSSLMGSLVYVGSVLFVTYAFYSDFMADGMVWLPLVIWSLELFTDKKIKWVFVSCVCLIVLSNFYFAFITSVYIFLYAICKYFILQPKFKIKTLIAYQINIVIHYIFGLLLGSISFFPAVYNFLNADRFGKEIQIPLFFDSIFYENLTYNLFFRISTITLPVICLFFLVAGFRIADREIKIRFLFTIFMVFLYCTPKAYSFFNGFSTIQFRWLYLFVFTIAFFIPFVMDYMVEKKKTFPIAFFSLFLILVIIIKEKLIGLTDVKEEISTTVIFLIGLIGFLLLCLNKKVSGRFIKVSLLSLTAINVLFVNFAHFELKLGPYNKLKEINENVFGERGIDNALEREIISYIENKDDTFYRIMWLNPKTYNLPMLYHYNGFSAYQSLIPYNISKFFKEHYNTLQIDSPSQFQNLDKRWYLETALGAKYYITPLGESHEPYGYSRLRTFNGYTLYQNDNYLPIGFMYNYGIDKEEFSKLNVAQRDQLLLYAAVTKENPAALGLKKFNTRSLNVTTLHKGMLNIESWGISKTGSKYVIENNGKMRIKIEKPKTEGEILVEIKMKPLHNLGYSVTVNNKKLEKRPANHPYSYPQESLVFNLGHKGLTDIVDISISPGEYKIETINIFFNPYSHIEHLIQKKKADGLTNIKYTEGSVKGKIKIDQDGLLYLSIPYSRGWKAKVDGNSVNLLETNQSFMGLPLKKGDHVIELNYVTPYFKEGAIVSVSMLIASILIILRTRKKNMVK